MPPRRSLRGHRRRRNESASRAALVVVLFLVGLMVAVGLGVWVYTRFQADGAANAADANKGVGVGNVFGIPGLQNGLPTGELVWPALQGKWVRASGLNPADEHFIEFTADRRLRAGMPGHPHRHPDGRVSVYSQDDPILRIESTGTAGEITVWYKSPLNQYDWFLNLQLVGDTLYRIEVSSRPWEPDRKIPYKKAR